MTAGIFVGGMLFAINVPALGIYRILNRKPGFWDTGPADRKRR